MDSGYTVSGMPLPSLTLEQLARRKVVLQGLPTKDLPSNVKEDLQSLATMQGNFVVRERNQNFCKADRGEGQLTPDEHKRALKIADKVIC